MDPGTVVWLPDGGWYNPDMACSQTYGNYYACGFEMGDGGTWAYCCPYGG
jgi:hypothetical protein